MRLQPCLLQTCPVHRGGVIEVPQIDCQQFATLVGAGGGGGGGE